MLVKVFFIKNCYRFCMDNREVEFENIIKVLNGSITLEGESEICEGKPLFVVDFTKNEDSSKGNNSLSYSLEIIENKNKDIILDETNKIKLIPVEQKKYTILGHKNEKEFPCETLLLELKDIIESMLPTLKIVEVATSPELSTEEFDNTPEPELSTKELDAQLDEALAYEDAKSGKGVAVFRVK